MFLSQVQPGRRSLFRFRISAVILHKKIKISKYLMIEFWREQRQFLYPFKSNFQCDELPVSDCVVLSEDCVVLTDEVIFSVLFLCVFTIAQW